MSTDASAGLVQLGFELLTKALQIRHLKHPRFNPIFLEYQLNPALLWPDVHLAEVMKIPYTHHEKAIVFFLEAVYVAVHDE